MDEAEFDGAHLGVGGVAVVPPEWFHISADPCHLYISDAFVAAIEMSAMPFLQYKPCFAAEEAGADRAKQPRRIRRLNLVW